MDLMSYIKTLGPNSESIAKSLIEHSDWIKQTMSKNSELIKVVDSSILKQFIDDKVRFRFNQIFRQHLETCDLEKQFGRFLCQLSIPLV